ncbi:hypothetical protein [Streptomyces sp. M41(2017)]|uniref:hypothetical protein n=1 Tax=Streptomyces sp. M41(2017) TaxID=1955065 RepID=UPI00117EAFBD|nr:hypothetical protein [Streptomyces sp. M41(2017)]
MNHWQARARPLPATTAAAVMAAALLAGCSSNQPPSPAAPFAATRNVHPLTDAQLLRISDAQQVLLRRCMNRNGFAYWQAQRLSLEESRTAGYVSDDVNWARKHGYGSRITVKDDRSRRHNPNIAYHASLSAAQRGKCDAAMDGGLDAPVITADLPRGGIVKKREGGCVAESEKQLYGDVRGWFRADKLASSLQALYVPKIMADPKFTTTLSAWSQCMNRTGHPFTDPGAARQAAAQQSLQLDAAQAFRAERDLAVADATCARRTSLTAIGKERENHYIKELPRTYRQALNLSRAFQHRALQRAAALAPPRT